MGLCMHTHCVYLVHVILFGFRLGAMHITICTCMSHVLLKGVFQSCMVFGMSTGNSCDRPWHSYCCLYTRRRMTNPFQNSFSQKHEVCSLSYSFENSKVLEIVLGLSVGLYKMC